MDKAILRLIVAALKEDGARRDRTSRLLIGAEVKAAGAVRARARGVLCGLRVARAVFLRNDPRCRVKLHARDGERVAAGRKLLSVQGNARGILGAERTALNFMQHLSGVATLTRRFVEAVRGTRAQILDTRKTIPGLRALQKYAVRMGGGKNHRMGLAEMIFVKDNHLKLISGDRQKVGRIKEGARSIPLVMEAENAGQIDFALRSRADILLLDNMPPKRLRSAVRRVRGTCARLGRRPPLLEVSGGVTLANVRALARSGADRISIGALTHSAPALDLSLELE